jgi:hypothetical protein
VDVPLVVVPPGVQAGEQGVVLAFQLRRAGRGRVLAQDDGAAQQALLVVNRIRVRFVPGVAGDVEGPGTTRPRTCPPDGWNRWPWRPQTEQEARANDMKPVDPAPGAGVTRDREALGRSRGGLTSKIHLVADTRCRPLARVTTAGQRHDSLAIAPAMAALRIARPGPGRPRTRPGRLLADTTYSSKATRTYLRRRKIKATIPEPADQIAGRRRKGSSTAQAPPRPN